MAVDFDEKSRMSVGIDAVSIQRIAAILDKETESFRSYVYTEAEQSYCDTQYCPSEHYAARWAVKEAFIKAVGIEGANPDLRSIEVLGDPAPHLSLSGEGLELLEQAVKRRETVPERTSVDVSLSHESAADIAIGVVWILYS